MAKISDNQKQMAASVPLISSRNTVPLVNVSGTACEDNDSIKIVDVINLSKTS